MSFNYSIIIPHKNIPNLLQRCLDSIPIRKDVEIIIVDDNSDSLEVDFNAFPGLTRINTFVVFDKSNKGAGHARNVGLNNARGKWIIFADADDYFLPKLLEKIDFFLNADSDIVLFKTICRNSYDPSQVGKRQKFCDIYNKHIDTFSKDRANYHTMMLEYVTPWGKLIKKDFLDQYKITFEEVPFSNDIGWATDVCLNIKKEKIQISKDILYCLTERESSLFHNNELEATFCRFMVFLRQHEKLVSHNLRKQTDFNSSCYIRNIRKKGSLKTLIFIVKLLKEHCSIPPIYNIEKKIKLNKPYLFFLVQFFEQILHIPPR